MDSKYQNRRAFLKKSGILIALFGGALALILVVGVAYYSTMAAFRFGLDPDTYGIPMVTSSLDLVGAFTLVIAMMTVGIA